MISCYVSYVKIEFVLMVFSAIQFITLQNGDERQRLVPVLNTILKLSPEEANLIATVVKGLCMFQYYI